ARTTARSGGRRSARSGADKALLRVIASDEPGFARAFESLVQRRDDDREDVEKAVRKIVERVREGGDEELIACVRRYDGAKLDALEVSPAEWDEAIARVDPADRAALGKAAMRVRDFHRKRIPSSWELREEGGAHMGMRVRPLARV